MNHSEWILDVKMMTQASENGTILIVEDEINFARYLLLEMVNEGYTADIAHDRVVGLQVALDKDYDVIFT